MIPSVAVRQVKVRLRRRFNQALRWLSGRIAARNYLLLVSAIIGLVAGLGAVLLKSIVFGLKDWLHGQQPDAEQLWFVILPLAGILLRLLADKLLFGETLTPGLSNLIHAISRKKVNLPAKDMYGHIIGSGLTVGFGGSVGLEAPIIRTGSAIGANLARLLLVGRKKQTLFLACGASAGMAAIFNTPIAGVLFAFEVLLREIALHSFIPLIIAAVTATLVSSVLVYQKIFFLPEVSWGIGDIPWFVGLGLLCGLLSVYLIRTVNYVSSHFNGFQRGSYRFLLGGLSLGLLIFLMPPLFGEGYATVNDLLESRIDDLLNHSPFYGLGDRWWFILLFITFLLFAKALATAITLSVGGNGGVFAPAMFTGATLGYLFVQVLNQVGGLQLEGSNFIVVAMAGMLSGVFKAPLTGIFLIAEITGGYNLFVPLMLVSALAYFTGAYFEPFSIFTRELFQQGLWVPAHEKDLTILKSMEIRSLVETNFTVVAPESTLGEFVRVIASSKRNVFPVVDADQSLKGIILLDDVRELMFDTSAYERIKVSDLMHRPPAFADVTEPMDRVMAKFDQHEAWNLPVLEQGKYVGFVSKSHIFSHYRKVLQDQKEEL
jgi:chloride channel protein, CIC family